MEHEPLINEAPPAEEVADPAVSEEPAEPAPPIYGEAFIVGPGCVRLTVRNLPPAPEALLLSVQHEVEQGTQGLPGLKIAARLDVNPAGEAFGAVDADYGLAVHHELLAGLKKAMLAAVAPLFPAKDGDR